MNLFKIFSVGFKHLSTIRKVSNTLSILVEHSEQIFPKLKEVWSDEINNSQQKVE